MPFSGIAYIFQEVGIREQVAPVSFKALYAGLKPLHSVLTFVYKFLRFQSRRGKYPRSIRDPSPIVEGDDVL